MVQCSVKWDDGLMVDWPRCTWLLEAKHHHSLE